MSETIRKSNSVVKYNIPGVTTLTDKPVWVSTDGGPWAEHNMPCAVCKVGTAVMELDGWIFQPCRECETQGWKLVKNKRRRFVPWRW